MKNIPQIGDKHLGCTVTEVRLEANQYIIFGASSKLPKSEIEALKKHFAKPEGKRGFIFRPGNRIDAITVPKASKRSKYILPDVLLAIEYICEITANVAVLQTKPILINECEIEFKFINTEMTTGRYIDCLVAAITKSVGVEVVKHHAPLEDQFIWNYDNKQVVVAWTAAAIAGGGIISISLID